MKKTRMYIYPIAAMAFIGLSSVASASISGTLTEGPGGACGMGGGVTVSALPQPAITWAPASDATHGCITAGSGTSLTWSGGGTLSNGAPGNILDLIAGGPPSVDGFMTFVTPAGTLDFVLTGLGPGSAASGLAACAAAATDSTKTCSINAGSPFVISLDGTLTNTTNVSLHAVGTVKDPNNPSQVSNWSGGFSVQLAGMTPLDVYDQFLANNTITTGQTGNFVVTANVTTSTPEPGTISLLLSGLGFIGLGAFRRFKK